MAPITHCTLQRPARSRCTAGRPTGAPPSALLLALATLACVPVPPAAAQPASPLELARRINTDPACTRTEFLGLCWCGNAPCGYWIRMYVPVAFAETVPAPGDSLLGAALPAGAPSPSTLSSSHSGLDHTAEAHAWVLGDTAWKLSGPAACLGCQPSDARAPAPPPSSASDLACGSISTVIAALVSSASFASPLPSLVYASEADFANWRTGCRDLAGLDPWIAGPLGDLGGWGRLYPRQMRDLGTSPVVYSCKTAFRALSIARDQLGTFPFPVDPAARMQQAYPAVSTCFDVGEQPLPQAPASDRGVQTSADGRYGWFYWRPTLCCVKFEALARCSGG